MLSGESVDLSGCLTDDCSSFEAISHKFVHKSRGSLDRFPNVHQVSLGLYLGGA